MGVFFCKKKSGKWGVLFVKKWTFLQRRVHYVQYQYFLFYLFGGAYAPNAPPCLYGPAVGLASGRASGLQKLSDVLLVWLSASLERRADCLHIVQLMPLPSHPKTPPSLDSFKSRLVLSFWYRLTQVVLEKRPLNGCRVS